MSEELINGITNYEDVNTCNPELNQQTQPVYSNQQPIIVSNSSQQQGKLFKQQEASEFDLNKTDQVPEIDLNEISSKHEENISVLEGEICEKCGKRNQLFCAKFFGDDCPGFNAQYCKTCRNRFCKCKKCGLISLRMFSHSGDYYCETCDNASKACNTCELCAPPPGNAFNACVYYFVIGILSLTAVSFIITVIIVLVAVIRG